MSKKTKTTSQSTQTTTPTNPSWVTKGLEDVGGSLSTLLGRNPLDFVAGPSSLQNKAWTDAGNLKLSDDYGAARNIFNDVAGAGANTYDSTGYDATDATSQGYDSVDYTGQGYDPTTGTAMNYDAINARGAEGYDAANATASNYSASSLLDGLGKYMSPYTGQVVDAALEDYDFGAGQTRSNQALDEARSGAFGGSGAAIGRSMTEGELARGRGSLSANLRDQNFTRGAGLSAQDAGFRNDASRFNADAQTRVSMSNADSANAASAFGANARNTFSLADADAANRAAAFNADAGNRFGLANMDASNTASRFGADARNTSSASNAAARNNALAFGADAGNRATLANSAARNDASRFGADARNTAGRYNAGAADTALDRRLNAGNSLASLGTSMGADTRANIALQNALGGDQRQVEQFLKSAPLDVLERIAKMYGGLPLNLLSGSTSTGSSSGSSKTWDPMDTAGKVINAAGTVATAFSDRRLKTDIERIGEREDGLGVYLFRYLWSPVRHIGVMAQEVLKVKPEAVIHTPSGFMAVDYGAL
jgi:hypothetical protein